MVDAQTQQANMRRLRSLVSTLSPRPRRSKLLPGESYNDYQRKLWQAQSTGMTEPEFEWIRLVRNGWTLEDERRVRDASHGIGYGIYKVRIRGENGQMKDVGYDLVEEGERLVREGKFPGMKKPTERIPGEDDETEAA